MTKPSLLVVIFLWCFTDLRATPPQLPLLGPDAPYFNYDHFVTKFVTPANSKLKPYNTSVTSSRADFGFQLEWADGDPCLFYLIVNKFPAKVEALEFREELSKLKIWKFALIEVNDAEFGKHGLTIFRDYEAEVRCLKINGGDFTSSSFSELKRYKKLEQLSLANLSLDEKIFEYLPTIKISFENCKFDTKALIKFASEKKHLSIRVVDTSVKVNLLFDLVVQDIQSVELPNLKIDKDSLEKLLELHKNGKIRAKKILIDPHGLDPTAKKLFCTEFSEFDPEKQLPQRANPSKK